MDTVSKRKRQNYLTDIVRSKRIESQLQLMEELKRANIHITQASISRDIVELGVVKVKGVYKLPPLMTDAVSLGKIVEVDSAGDNLIVVKTPPGQASMIALAVDNKKIPGIIGTVAGDDTFFVAVKSYSIQKVVMKRILQLIQ